MGGREASVVLAMIAQQATRAMTKLRLAVAEIVSLMVPTIAGVAMSAVPMAAVDCELVVLGSRARFRVLAMASG